MESEKKWMFMLRKEIAIQKFEKRKNQFFFSSWVNRLFFLLQADLSAGGNTTPTTVDFNFVLISLIEFLLCRVTVCQDDDKYWNDRNSDKQPDCNDRTLEMKNLCKNCYVQNHKKMGRKMLEAFWHFSFVSFVNRRSW